MEHFHLHFLLQMSPINFISRVYLFNFTGRRMCPGKQMAKVELFLVLGNLLQQFRPTFKFPEDEANPALDDLVDNIVSTHKAFTVRAVLRT